MRWVLMLLLSTSPCLAHGEEDSATRTCDAARRTNGWCEEAGVGYVASVEIRSRMLYEALDAHGHDFEPTAITCKTCRDALEHDGFCQAHRIGFVRGQGYLSPLTYHIARGQTVHPETIDCPVCREHTRGIGWCEKHHVGIAGLTAISDRREFEKLARAYELLLAAVDLSAQCEMCAAAMVADGYCPDHRVKYRDGTRVPISPP